MIIVQDLVPAILQSNIRDPILHFANVNMDQDNQRYKISTRCSAILMQR